MLLGTGTILFNLFALVPRLDYVHKDFTVQVQNELKKVHDDVAAELGEVNKKQAVLILVAVLTQPKLFNQRNLIKELSFVA